jgi:hypothetical protein
VVENHIILVSKVEGKYLQQIIEAKHLPENYLTGVRHKQGTRAVAVIPNTLLQPKLYEQTVVFIGVVIDTCLSSCPNSEDEPWWWGDRMSERTLQ